MTDASIAAQRLPDLEQDQMTPEQRAAADDMLSGPRTSLHGPFHAWLRSPQAGMRLARVGEYLRYESPLPKAVQEVAILVTARHCRSDYEWQAHVRHARAAGLSEAAIAKIQSGDRPEDVTESEAATYDFCDQLLRNNKVNNITYELARDQLGEAGLIDLVALLGLYLTVAMTLSIAGVPVPQPKIPG
jgi:4-carboxymuconolactone decarboxylase